MRLIAHRGCRKGGAENSLAGLAGLPPDLAGVEIDVRVTSDNVPVLLHDAVLDRVTNGTGLIEAVPFAHLQKLKLDGTQEPPAQLDVYLSRAAALFEANGFDLQASDAPDIYLDIKTSDPRAVLTIAELVRSLPFAQRIVCLCKEERPLSILSSTAVGGLRLGLLRCSRENVDTNLRLAHEYGAEVLFVQHGLEAFRANIDIVVKIRSAGFLAGGSVLNGEEALDLARRAGCDLVLTDFPTTDAR